MVKRNTQDPRESNRIAAEQSLEHFINLVHPQRLLGSIHKELIGWWNRGGAKSHQLVLLPRDHMKSALAAYRVAWEITKDPTLRVLYISSTANLAQKQLGFIKDIFLSKRYQAYWPEMVNNEEGRRKKWTETEIVVDHPLRAYEAVRDPTIFTAGLTTSITGLHFDIAVLDDVVVKENAYTEEGREKVRTQYSLLASIEGAESRQWVVGTRYHPKDLYNDMLEMAYEKYDDQGEVSELIPLYEILERQVEDTGDGTGEFLWPRQRRSDGKWFGFDKNILAKKRAAYLDKLQFRAQYYNDPNDPEEAAINPDCFQYYDPKYVRREMGRWYFKHKPLNIFASVDFAFSLQKKADYTAIVIVGIDSDNNYYILDIDRFKSDKISEYFEHILRLHQKWDFRKLRAEVSVAQQVIVKDLKQNYIRPHGLALSIEEFRPSRHQGSKEERMQAVLQPRYDNRQVWHYPGGNTQILEEELISYNPPHDDVKDCLASCMDFCVPPSGSRFKEQGRQMRQNITHTRFGGIA